MKSITTIALSFYFLLAGFIPNMDFHELAKLPVLIEHFLDCREDNSETLLAFLELHYGSNGQKDQNHQDQDEHDGKLPFQSHHSCHSCHIFVAFSPSPPLLYAEVKLAEGTFSNYQYIVSSEHLDSIFQPPKA